MINYTTEWKFEEWEACTATCGSGRQSRTQICALLDGKSTPAPGKCKGLGTEPLPETRPCDSGTSCAVLTYVGEWGACSVTCGSGTQSQTQKCMYRDGTPAAPGECEGTPLKITRACDAGRACPIWKFLNVLEPCPVTCGNSSQSLTQQCVHPADDSPAPGECEGRPTIQSWQCSTGISCAIWEYRDGDWGPCSATCGSGIESNQQVCLYHDGSEAPPTGVCPGTAQTDTRDCHAGLPCNDAEASK